MTDKNEGYLYALQVMSKNKIKLHTLHGNPCDRIINSPKVVCMFRCDDVDIAKSMLEERLKFFTGSTSPFTINDSHLGYMKSITGFSDEKFHFK